MIPHSYTSLEDGLYDAFHTLLPDIEVYFSYENGVEPATPYGFITILSQQANYSGEEGAYTDAPDTKTFIQNMTASVKIQFMGTTKQNVGNICELLYAKLRSSQGRFAFSDQGITLASMDQFQRIAVPRETEISVAHYLNFTITYTSYTDISTTTIDTIEVDGLAGSIPVTIEITP